MRRKTVPAAVLLMAIVMGLIVGAPAVFAEESATAASSALAGESATAISNTSGPVVAEAEEEGSEEESEDPEESEEPSDPEESEEGEEASTPATAERVKLNVHLLVDGERQYPDASMLNQMNPALVSAAGTRVEPSGIAANGFTFDFTEVPEGDYSLEFSLPQGYRFAAGNAGSMGSYLDSGAALHVTAGNIVNNLYTQLEPVPAPADPAGPTSPTGPVVTPTDPTNHTDPVVTPHDNPTDPVVTPDDPDKPAVNDPDKPAVNTDDPTNPAVDPNNTVEQTSSTESSSDASIKTPETGDADGIFVLGSLGAIFAAVAGLVLSRKARRQY